MTFTLFFLSISISLVAAMVNVSEGMTEVLPDCPLIHHLSPPRQTWRQAETHNIYQLLLLTDNLQNLVFISHIFFILYYGGRNIIECYGGRNATISSEGFGTQSHCLHIIYTLLTHCCNNAQASRKETTST